MDLQIIYTELRVYLSKKSYASWKEIQNEFFDFKTSLGLWPANEVIEYLTDEYSYLKPSASEQVKNFIQDKVETCELSFDRP